MSFDFSDDLHTFNCKVIIILTTIMRIYCCADEIDDDELEVSFSNGNVITSILETETFMIFENVSDFDEKMKEIYHALDEHHLKYTISYGHEFEHVIEIGLNGYESTNDLFDKLEEMLKSCST